MNKNIVNINSKGQYHGYQEWYRGGELHYKGFFHNDVDIDYEEYYYFSGEFQKCFYI